MKWTLSLITVAVIAVLVALGCGGGSSASGNSPTNLSVFATDDLNTNYSHVWVTISSVEVGTSMTGPFTTVFSEPSGRTVDLRTLRDNTGQRFSFLGQGPLPAGTYTHARVTMAKQLNIVQTGQTNGQTVSFDDRYGTGAQIQYTFELNNRNINGNPRLVIDFDLSQWNLVGGFVVIAIREGDGTGLDDVNRHEDEDFTGVVRDLGGAAPDQTFLLSRGNRGSFLVNTNMNTAIFNSDGSPNPVLAVNQEVEVRGKFNPARRTLLAATIKIKVGEGSEPPHQIKGKILSFSIAARTITVEPKETGGFIPPGTQLVLQMSDITRYFSQRGILVSESDFFGAVDKRTILFVEAEGTMVAGATTMNVVRIKAEGDGSGDNGGGDNQNGHEAELRGPVFDLNKEMFKFKVTVQEFEGFPVQPGTAVLVEAGPSTTYRTSGGTTLSKAEFFAQVQNGRTVKAHGSFNPSTKALAADRIELRI